MKAVGYLKLGDKIEGISKTKKDLSNSFQDLILDYAMILSKTDSRI